MKLLQRRAHHDSVDDFEFTCNQNLCAQLLRQKLPCRCNCALGVCKVHHREPSSSCLHGVGDHPVRQLLQSLLIRRGRMNKTCPESSEGTEYREQETNHPDELSFSREGNNFTAKAHYTRHA